jgi:hypothetical protein
MTAKEETKQNHQSSTNIHITQTGARTHTQQANGRAVPNQNCLAARILLRNPGTQLSEWITTGVLSGSVNPSRDQLSKVVQSYYPPHTWILVAGSVTLRREGLTLWSQVDHSAVLGGGELTV